MSNQPFDRPVKFFHGASLVRHISNIDAALYFLEHKWPFLKSNAHQNAVRICKQVLDGSGTAKKARVAFARALEEANFDLVE